LVDQSNIHDMSSEIQRNQTVRLNHYRAKTISCTAYLDNTLQAPFVTFTRFTLNVHPSNKLISSNTYMHLVYEYVFQTPVKFSDHVICALYLPHDGNA
jgi:hypothetical protein